jgi:hypothetical protein
MRLLMLECDAFRIVFVKPGLGLFRRSKFLDRFALIVPRTLAGWRRCRHGQFSQLFENSSYDWYHWLPGLDSNQRPFD